MARWVLVVGLVSLITACATSPGQPATAQSDTSATSGKVASSDKQEKQSDLICTTGMEIGSHIPQRTCYTRKEAEQRKKTAQQAVQNLTSGPSSGSSNCSPSC